MLSQSRQVFSCGWTIKWTTLNTEPVLQSQVDHKTDHSQDQSLDLENDACRFKLRPAGVKLNLATRAALTLDDRPIECSAHFS